MVLESKRFVIGVTGGIAAYKTCELVRLLRKQGATVQVVMTEAATRFVTPLTFQALSGTPVYVDSWDERSAALPSHMPHIDLTRGADAILVAPASADFLARVAQGMANDLLSTLVLARDCPLIVAPAMNRQMWNNPATQRNIAVLMKDGVTIFGPDSGEQACGEVGEGRMLEAEALVDDLQAWFVPKSLAGRRVVLTAGPTFEALDPVRGMTNLSSGKMGFALARAACCAGAEVLLVAGPVALPTPRGVGRINVQSAQEMRQAVWEHIEASDVFIGVAAVADYRPDAIAEHKIKKGDEIPSIRLVQNPDILAEVAARVAPPLCVGFAAETKNLAEYAQKKRLNKKIPLIVGNLIGDGFGGDSNSIVLFDEAGAHPLPPGKKSDLAMALILHIAAMLERSPS